MNIKVLTLFPEMIENTLSVSMTGRAIEKGLLEIEAVNIRDYAFNKHHSVDDYPYGGGAGMLMQAEPIYQAYAAVSEKMEKKPRVVFLAPHGETFSQDKAIELSKEENLIFLCGHYEGVDERVVEEIVTDVVSIGDYVLTGGELPAMVMIDAISRFLPGVLHNEDSAYTDSFQGSLLEYPQYSRPETWHDKKVPAILLSGNHAKVDEWRRLRSVIRTAKFRPDLLKNADLTTEEKELCKKILDDEDFVC
ncbi:MAG: tRNA (guanosine(37)-N1)-methyltransferase TrmD [Clostridiales bacterium]|nr:tRNA (guanosine(37)-N1)-methyltransferase TrmD [Clostridiales bacterium]